ncbi:hypothetical protein NL676_032976 [Syzygium grande]|nr:hypothetical protein NL676_032976 [Syzygium grande]
MTEPPSHRCWPDVARRAQAMLRPLSSLTLGKDKHATRESADLEQLEGERVHGAEEHLDLVRHRDLSRPLMAVAHRPPGPAPSGALRRQSVLALCRRIPRPHNSNGAPNFLTLADSPPPFPTRYKQ